MAFVVGELVAGISGDARDFFRTLDKVVAEGQKSARKVGRAFEQIGRNLRFAGQDLSVTLTAPLVAAGAIAARAAIQFESSFAGVRKTVNATEEEFARLERQLRQLAAGPNAIPVDVDDLNRIAEEAGQLGVQVPALVDFTRTIAELRATTNLGDDAAASLARLTNIMGTADTDTRRLASAVVRLGNGFDEGTLKLATTEREIVGLGLRLAGVGRQIGLTEAQVLGFAAALSSVGVPEEAGATAFQRLFIDIQRAVAIGGRELDEFARVSGRSVAEFAELFERDANEAILSFIEGIGKLEESGESAILVLDKLGLADQRVFRAITAIASAGELARKAIDLSNDGWQAQNALTEEAAKRFGTVESQLQKQRNAIRDAAIDIGRELTPALLIAAETAATMARAFANLPAPVQRSIIAFAALAASVGPILFVTGNLLSSFAKLTRTAAALGPLFSRLARQIGVLPELFRQVSRTSGRALANLPATLRASARATELLSLKLTAAAAAAVLVGKAIERWADSLNQLEGPRALFVEQATASEEFLNRQFELLNALRARVFEVFGEKAPDDLFDTIRKTPEDAGKLFDTLERLVAINRQYGLAVQGSAAAQRELNVLLARPGQTPEQFEAVEKIIAALREEKERLEVGEESWDSYLARKNLAGPEQQRIVDGLLREIGALKAEADALKQSTDARRAAGIEIAQTLDDLEAQVIQLRGFNQEAITLARLSELGAGEVAAERARALFQEIAALEAKADKQREVDEIVERSLSLDQRKAIEIARVNALIKEGSEEIGLSAQQAAQAIAEIEERYTQLAKRATKEQDRLKQAGANLARGLENAFANFLENTEDGFRSLGQSVVRVLRDIAAQIAASQLVGLLAGAFTPRIPVAQQQALGSSTILFRPFATGGPVKAPKGSDSLEHARYAKGGPVEVKLTDRKKFAEGGPVDTSGGFSGFYRGRVGLAPGGPAPAHATARPVSVRVAPERPVTRLSLAAGGPVTVLPATAPAVSVRLARPGAQSEPRLATGGRVSREIGWRAPLRAGGPVVIAPPAPYDARLAAGGSSSQRPGLVRGPGGPRTDSVPALLSRGEYVIRQQAVGIYGEPFLDAINQMKLPVARFAAGGIVGPAGPAGSAGSGTSLTQNFTIDARGAEAGVEQRIVRAIQQAENRAVARSVGAVAEVRRRGGSFSRALGS